MARTFALRLLPVIALLFVATVPGRVFASAEAPNNTIEIKSYKYVPDQLTVHVGDKVTWINRDQVPHTIAEKNKVFRSAALDTGDSFSYTFASAGSFTYFCTLHPQMTGTVTVAP